MAHKFFDYLEANAEEFWEPPQFVLGYRGRRSGANGADESVSETQPQSSEDGRFNAAYADFVYNDTTNDGVDSDTPEEGGNPQTTTELIEESNRLNQHLTFLTALAQMWKGAALSRHLHQELTPESSVREQRMQAMAAWAGQAARESPWLAETA